VDHVEGYLREKFDALDAFLCHTWAVTVTGAPKTWAIQFVENNERSPRCWYGGAVGLIGFDGSLNTGLTLRTVRVKKGVAEVRAGATLLYDSDPTAEELETELKASAMIDAIVQDHSDPANTDAGPASNEPDESSVGKGKKIILIDHEDSFVHTLGNYLRQTGAEVTTLRSGPSSLHTIQKMSEEGHKPDMVRLVFVSVLIPAIRNTNILLLFLLFMKGCLITWPRKSKRLWAIQKSFSYGKPQNSGVWCMSWIARNGRAFWWGTWGSRLSDARETVSGVSN
jgi:hypothetical protein